MLRCASGGRSSLQNSCLAPYCAAYVQDSESQAQMKYDQYCRLWGATPGARSAAQPFRPRLAAGLVSSDILAMMLEEAAALEAASADDTQVRSVCGAEPACRQLQRCACLAWA